MRPMMFTATTVGFIFGGLHGWQNAIARLTGYAENSIEQEKFGIMASETSSPPSNDSTSPAISATSS